MSTAAAEPAPPIQTASGSAPSLLIGSILGSVIILAGFVAAGYAADAVPATTPYLEVARTAVYLLVVGGTIALGGFLAGRNPARGVSGGIILTVSVVIAAAFVAAAFAANFKDGVVGPVLTGITLAAAGFGIFRVLTSQQGIGWCQAIDDQGWASFHSHKRTQGLLVRRFTTAGILVLGITGAVALYNADPFKPSLKATQDARNTTTAPAEQQTPADQVVDPPLNYQVPFTDKAVPLVPVARLALPALICLFTVWVAWRAVNVPTFGDFLIATEAEMNKVSWTSRKRLIQDTIVVLVCLALLTLFLFAIDMFWSWLLSLEFIGVLPKGKAGSDAAALTGTLDW